MFCGSVLARIDHGQYPRETEGSLGGHQMSWVSDDSIDNRAATGEGARRVTIRVPSLKRRVGMTIDSDVDSRHSMIAPSLVLVLAVVMTAGSMASCASVKNPPGTVTAQFFQNPDRVWEAIQLSLETLEYVVESSNRDEGVIRAARPADDPTPWVALDINQVMYTGDQVNVFVRGVAEEPPAAPSQDVLDKAAQDFVTVLKRKLGG
jgi:hypothetical protein